MELERELGEVCKEKISCVMLFNGRGMFLLYSRFHLRLNMRECEHVLRTNA